MSKISKQNTVLAVDDYPAGLMVLTMLLELEGYAVETADCGFAAVKKVRSAAEPYRAILMDIKMHDMDGFEVTKIIRQIEVEKKYRNHIIAVTANAMSGYEQFCLDSGMDDYISKPINPSVLAQKLATMKIAA
jgi:CheY-like chemotaxis protein